MSTFSSHLPSNTGVVIAERTSNPPLSSSLSWSASPTRTKWTAAAGSGRSDRLRSGNGDSGKALYELKCSRVVVFSICGQGTYCPEGYLSALINGLVNISSKSCITSNDVSNPVLSKLHPLFSLVVSHPESWPLSRFRVFMNKTCNLAVAIVTGLRQGKSRVLHIWFHLCVRTCICTCVKREKSTPIGQSRGPLRVKWT